MEKSYQLQIYNTLTSTNGNPLDEDSLFAESGLFKIVDRNQFRIELNELLEKKEIFKVWWNNPDEPDCIPYITTSKETEYAWSVFIPKEKQYLIH